MPTPPASTTWAACRASSWSSVRTTAARAASTAASRARPRVVVAVIAVVRGVHGGRGPGGSLHDGEHGAGHGVAQRGPGPDLGPVQGRGQQR